MGIAVGIAQIRLVEGRGNEAYGRALILTKGPLCIRHRGKHICKFHEGRDLSILLVIC